MNFKVSPLLVIGVLIGALGVAVSPASAQASQGVDYANSPIVTYISDDSQLGYGTPGGIIRFVKSGIYHWNAGIVGGNVTIQGPGSFYMDSSAGGSSEDPPSSSTPEGQRALTYGVTILGSGSGRFIAITGGTVSISGVTLMNFGLSNGSFDPITLQYSPDAFGGTIYNAGDLTLKNVTIVNSKAIAASSGVLPPPVPDVTDPPTAPTPTPPVPDPDNPGGSALGGSVYNSGTLTMSGCTILNSIVQTDAFGGARAMGGGVYSSGTMNLANCTFENTHAYGKTRTYSYSQAKNGHFTAGGSYAAGGAIAVDSGTSTINNITITTSSASAAGTEVETDGAYGGGVYGTSDLPITNSFAQDCHVSIGTRPNFQYSTALFPLPPLTDPPTDPTAPDVVYVSGTAVGSVAATGTTVFPFNIETWNYGSTSMTNLVTPLQDNGGSTLTRAPVSANFLVDSGSGSYATVGTVDQRGANRILMGQSPNIDPTTAGAGARVDIGAVEYDPNNPISGGNTAPFVERGTTTASEGDGTISFSNGNGNPLTVKDANDVNSATGNALGTTIVEATIDSPDAIVKLGPDTSRVTIISQTDHHIVLRGTIADINKALDGLTLYIYDTNEDYPPDFSITINDLGNVGYGGALDYSDITTHYYVDPTSNPLTYITPVNTPPFVLAPGKQVVKYNATQTDSNLLSFSSSNGNPIVVGDLDLNASDDTTLPYDRSQLQMKVDLTVSHGVLLLGNTTGLLISHDNGNKHFTIQGSWELLNSTLSSLSYRPDDGYLGNDSLSVTVNDLGNYGTGGPLTASAVVPIIVNKDGAGSEKNGNVGWFISNITKNGMNVSVTYVFVNGSNTDITNFVASGSILGGAYFDTANATISPSVGVITKEFASPIIQRQLDPSKNGLFVTWATPAVDPTQSIVIRQGRSISLTVTVPFTPGALGKAVTGSWKVSFDPVNSDVNVIKPAPTSSAFVPVGP